LLMKKPKKPGKLRPGAGVSPARANRKGAKTLDCCSPPGPGDPKIQGNDALIEQVRQVIAATPEVRPEKVEPLRKAVQQGAYEVDTRKLANCLIAKLFLEP